MEGHKKETALIYNLELTFNYFDVSMFAKIIIMRTKFLLIVLSTAIFTTSCVSVKVAETQDLSKSILNQKPKNIILLIGDGMGLSEVSASLYYGDNKTNFERFPVIGLSKTSASSDLITDSAAGATALSAGLKTYNGAIGVDKDTVAAITILEKLEKRGFATGLIATSSIVHATPASFFAHVKSRQFYDEIATYLPSSGTDFIAGGGLNYFRNRKDNKDLIAELKNNGYETYLENIPKEISEKKMAMILAPNAMPTIIEDRGDYLTDVTKLGLEKLSKNEKGFFIMIEGSQIDWGGHSNDADYLIAELLDFDKAIGAALDFAERNKNTLVIVTADHETGGFTLASDNNDYNKIKPTFSTTGHSGTMVPVFAKGPGQQLFGGMYENTSIYDKMMLLLSE